MGCVFRQLATRGAEIQLGKLAVGGFSQTITNTDIPGRTAHIQRRITDCSIVFQINKYVNLTCFLNVCKHIMVFLCFSRVKILHTAPLKDIFRFGLSEPVKSWLPEGKFNVSLKDFMDYALLCAGSSFTVGVVEEESGTASASEMEVAPECVHKMAATTTPCSVIAATHKSSQVTADVKEPSQVTADVKEPSQVTADVKEPSQVTADVKKLSQVPADVKKPGQVSADVKKSSQVPADVKKPGQVSADVKSQVKSQLMLKSQVKSQPMLKDQVKLQLIITRQVKLQLIVMSQAKPQLIVTSQAKSQVIFVSQA